MTGLPPITANTFRGSEDTLTSYQKYGHEALLQYFLDLDSPYNTPLEPSRVQATPPASSTTARIVRTSARDLSPQRQRVSSPIRQRDYHEKPQKLPHITFNLKKAFDEGNENEAYRIFLNGYKNETLNSIHVTAFARRTKKYMSEFASIFNVLVKQGKLDKKAIKSGGLKKRPCGIRIN